MISILRLTLIIKVLIAVMVPNDMTHYQRDTVTTIKTQTGGQSFNSILNFNKTYTQPPNTIFLNHQQITHGACITNGFVTATNVQVNLVITDANYYAVCSWGYLAIDKSVKGVATQSNIQFLMSANGMVQTKSKSLVYSLTNFNLSTTEKFLCSQTFVNTKYGASFNYSLNLSVNSSDIILTITSINVEQVRVSVIFFDLSVYKFMNFYRSALVHEIYETPVMNETSGSLYVSGLTIVRSGVPGSNHLYYRAMENNQPVFRLGAPFQHQNIYQFLTIYIRDKACIPGRYDPHTDQSTCLCLSGFQRALTTDENRLCLPLDQNITLNYLGNSQYLNQIQVFFAYSKEVKFIIPLRDAIVFKLDGEQIIPQNIAYQGGQIKIKFKISKNYNSIELKVKNGTTQNGTQTIFYPGLGNIHPLQLYLYSLTQSSLLNVTSAILAHGNSTMVVLKSCGLVFGGVGFVLDLIEFTQQCSLYLFLNMRIPSNLRTILQILYLSKSIGIIPIQISPPFPQYENDFIRPQIYDQYDVSLNFISSQLYQIVQIIMMFVVYYGIDLVARNLTTQGFFGCFGRTFKKLYENKAYSHSVECFLSQQVMISFSGVIVMLDRRLNLLYKLSNTLVALIFLLIVGLISTTFHPLYLTNTKKSKKVNTQLCYPWLIRQQSLKRNQYYLAIRSVTCLLYVLTIPLLPGSLSVVIIMVSLIVELVVVWNLHFQRKFYRNCRIFQLFSQITIHLLFIVLWILQKAQVSAMFWNIIIGYAIAALIVTNICVDLLSIFIQITYSIFKFIKAKCNRSIFKNQKHIIRRKNPRAPTLYKKNTVAPKKQKTKHEQSSIVIKKIYSITAPPLNETTQIKRHKRKITKGQGVRHRALHYQTRI